MKSTSLNQPSNNWFRQESLKDVKIFRQKFVGGQDIYRVSNVFPQTFFFPHVACGILVPPAGIKPVTAAVEAQSPNR